MTVAFDTVPGEIGKADPIRFSASLPVVSISAEFNAAAGNGPCETIYDGTDASNANGSFRHLYRDSAHVGNEWTIRRESGWPATVALRIKEAAGATAVGVFVPPPPSPGRTGHGAAEIVPQTVLRTYRDAIREISPWWLRGPIGGSVLYAIGSVVDLFGDGLRAGVKMRFPGFYSSESLPLIGRERRIRRGRYELDETYVERLVPWLDHHRTRGGPYALLAQVHAFYRPSNFSIELRYASGRRFVMSPDDGSIVRGNIVWSPPDGAAPLWARWWLIYQWPYAIDDDGTWDSPGVFDDGGVWDCNLAPDELRDIRLVPREWNAAHAIGYITLDSSAVGGIVITISAESS